MTFTHQMGQGMAAALDRVNNNDDPVELREENRQLKQTIKMLKDRIGAQSKTIEKYQAARSGSPVVTVEPAADAWEQLGFRHYQQGNREAGTQKELAKRLLGSEKKGYTINKWVAAGRIPTVTTPDNKQSVWLDQQRPTRKQRQKK